MTVVTTDLRLQQAKDTLAAFAGEPASPEAGRLDFPVEADKLVAAVAALHAARWGYLASITGLDLGAEGGQFEVLYQFCSGAAVVTLRVRTARAAGSVPSLYTILPPAVVFERELAEMFGLSVIGLPDPSRLFLPDDWPDGLYPLRKDAALDALNEGERP